MADTANQPSSGAAPEGQAATKVKKEKKVKNPRAKPSHPPTSEMVNNAIKGLKERGGSSLQAIKKYVAANYKVDAEKVAPFIKKYLKSAVVGGALVQTKGKGASGSFKLASAAGAGEKKASAGKAKKSTAGKPSKPKSAAGAKKAAPKAKKEKKAAAPKAKKPASEKKAAAPAVAKPKAPSKAKKSNKAGPTKKPKAPKPKTAKPSAASKSPKKAAGSPKRKK